MGATRFVVSQDGKRAIQFLRYVENTFGLLGALGRVADGRQRPIIPTQRVVGSLFLGAALRVRSLNELEGHLCRPALQRALGAQAREGEKLLSADTLSRELDGLDCPGLERLLEGVVGKAGRNKVFREGEFGNLRCVALDGWEPFSSFVRHCDGCLTREVGVGEQRKTLYYHRVVVALLLGFTPEVVLGVEPLRSADLRSDLPETSPDRPHEGELTAGLRLIRNLREAYGSWIDLFVLDALYANGSTFRALDDCHYGGIVTLKKETDEPFREALALAPSAPTQRWWDEQRLEEVEVHDIDRITTLDSYPKPVRVILATVRNPKKGEPSHWAAAVVGKKARSLPPRTAHRIQRGRWHIENTAFHQFATALHLGRAWRHTSNAVRSLFLLWMLASNAVRLFAFRRLRLPAVPSDPCRTLAALVLEIREALARLTSPWPWPRGP